MRAGPWLRYPDGRLPSGHLRERWLGQDDDGPQPWFPILSLDNITWTAVGVRMPLPDSLAALERFMADHPEWVIEGCYGELVEAVIVHDPGNREGPGCLRCGPERPRPARRRRCATWRRQVSMTVSMRSTKRLPAADCVPNDSFRQITA